MLVHELVERLRRAVNVPEVQDRLIKDRRLWRQLCSAMDVMEDTETAIASYRSSAPLQDIGSLYLLAYGLLQVLFVQQDAVKHATEAAGLDDYEFPEDVLAIRDVRNRAIGHPTKREKRVTGGGKKLESFGIMQMSLSHEGFILYSFDWDRPDAVQRIRFEELIAAQSKAVAQAIEQMIRHLKTAR